MNNVKKTMLVSMITNLFLALLKLISGLIIHSSALLADGVHSMSDLLTDLFAIVGDVFSRKPADLKHPYGHGKIEYITSIGISLLILGLGFSLIYNVTGSKLMISSILVSIISIITIVLKYLLSAYIIKQGYKYKNNILIASGKESRTDVLSSLIVFISAILGLFSKYISLFKYSDKIAGIIVGLFIIKTGFDILKENISTIIGEQEIDGEEIDKIKKIINSNKEIKSIDNLVVIKYGHSYEVVLEVSMDGYLSLIKSHQIIDEIEKEIESKIDKVMYINTHVNPIEEK